MRVLSVEGWWLFGPFLSRYDEAGEGLKREVSHYDLQGSVSVYPHTTEHLLPS